VVWRLSLKRLISDFQDSIEIDEEKGARVDASTNRVGLSNELTRYQTTACTQRSIKHERGVYSMFPRNRHGTRLDRDVWIELRCRFVMSIRDWDWELID
jgi:hypothetical protein